MKHGIEFMGPMVAIKLTYNLLSEDADNIGYTFREYLQISTTAKGGTRFEGALPRKLYYEFSRLCKIAAIDYKIVQLQLERNGISNPPPEPDGKYDVV